MSTIKLLWPTAFKIEKGNVGSFVVQLLLFLAACTVLGWMIGLMSHLWIIGWIFALVGGLLELYSAAGVVFCILNFVGVLS